MVVLMADKKKGIAMQTIESLSPMLRGVFDTIQPEVEEDE